MKIFTIFKCLIRFLNLLFTILKFLVAVLSMMWRKFPLTEVVMPSNKASSDAGPELASRESHEAMESPKALMCPLEKGVRGIEISGQCGCSASLT